jgi:hypothetical protein
VALPGVNTSGKDHYVLKDIHKSTIDHMSTVMLGEPFAGFYGGQKKGKMIPLNDIWIAAHAIETGSKSM